MVPQCWIEIDAHDLIHRTAFTDLALFNCFLFWFLPLFFVASSLFNLLVRYTYYTCGQSIKVYLILRILDTVSHQPTSHSVSQSRLVPLCGVACCTWLQLYMISKLEMFPKKNLQEYLWTKLKCLVFRTRCLTFQVWRSSNCHRDWLIDWTTCSWLLV